MTTIHDMETIRVVFYHAKKLTGTMFRAGTKKAEVSNTYPRYKKADASNTCTRHKKSHFSKVLANGEKVTDNDTQRDNYKSLFVYLV